MNRFYANLRRPLTQVTTATDVGGTTNRTTNYNYDGLLRVITASMVSGDVYSYGYDLAGNRTSVQVNGKSPTTRSYDAADQVSTAGWSYDGAGNLVSDGSASYRYNALNRLTGVTRSAVTTSYGYNGDGVLANETTGSSTTSYTLDTAGGLAERLGATVGGTSTWYVRGWGQEISRESGGTTNAWYLTDRLGSVRLLTNSAGAVTNSYVYDTFGGPQGPAPTDYGYTGEPQNATLGLVQLRARWYGVQEGRFLTTDPVMGNPQQPMSLQRYLYGNDDPINRTDPTGGCSAQHPAQLNQVTECDKFIEEMRTIVNSAQPDFWASLNYAALNAGHDLRRDSIALFTGVYYTYLPKDTLEVAILNPVGLFALGPQAALLLQISSAPPNGERHPFRIQFPDGTGVPKDVADGQDMLSIPYLKQQHFSSYQQAISFIEQHNTADLLNYGFRSDYWTNTHHFFLGWYYGYAGGAAFGKALNAAVVAKLHGGGNPTDSAAGDLGAEIGDSFRFGWISPERLPDVLKAQMCISAQERADLLRLLP